MNLRSVFTAEQQRILERYYENGMTNQSKACFQLILQCAQEAKLDFSVVRTWVGNKRRKLASKVELNGGMSHSLSSHGLASGLLSNHTLAGVLCPASSSPLSSSPISSDVILTGIYSLGSVPRSRQRTTGPSSQSDSELPPSSLISQALQSRSSSTLLAPPLQVGVPVSMHPIAHVSLRTFSLHCSQKGSFVTWRSGGQHRGRSSTSQLDEAVRYNAHPPRPLFPSQKTSASPARDSYPWIQQAFSLSEANVEDRLGASQGASEKGLQSHRPPLHPRDTVHNFSIAMETGDEEDEWRREEELANMAAQTHIRAPASPDAESLTPPAASSRPTMLHSSVTLQGSFSAQTSFTGESSTQVRHVHPFFSFLNNDLMQILGGISAAPWVLNSSRKRTLQDRTQFSDGDLIQLKHYWDRGMTSLGSVCREKINAAATQLGVDTEIVRTWISNRRRKYRLMGIEIPPPKGGPAVFTASSPGIRSTGELSPGEDSFRTPESREDLNDGGSVSLSEDGTVDSQHRDREEDTDGSTAAPLADSVKIEVLSEDEEDDDDYDRDLVSSDIEQIQSLLEFKHEEVQFLENELENQKQKYQELASFTKSLLTALRSNDLERQQVMVAD
uniref:Ribosomal protein S6 kinase a, like n=1 Tax=Tetraodon nigroviridis TaxID=99883 RepID=H3DEA8_TETNG